MIVDDFVVPSSQVTCHLREVPSPSRHGVPVAHELHCFLEWHLNAARSLDQSVALPLVFDIFVCLLFPSGDRDVGPR